MILQVLARYHSAGAWVDGARAYLWLTRRFRASLGGSPDRNSHGDRPDNRERIKRGVDIAGKPQDHFHCGYQERYEALAAHRFHCGSWVRDHEENE